MLFTVREYYAHNQPMSTTKNSQFNMQGNMPDELLTTEEVASILRVKNQTLRKWRIDNIGPPYMRVGSSIRYSRNELVQYLINNISTR